MLNNICQFSVKLYSFLRSALNFAQLALEPSFQKTLVSSANLSILSHMPSSISFINSTKRIGSSTESWGTSILKSDQSEHLPLITTRCFLWLSHDLIQLAIWSQYPKLWLLVTAFHVEPCRMPFESLTSSGNPWSIYSVTFSINCNKIVRQARLLTEITCWDSLSKSFTFM